MKKTKTKSLSLLLASLMGLAFFVGSTTANASEKEIVLDMASYQANMTTQQIKETKATTAIIKLTEGTGYTNPYIGSQIDRCKKAGVKNIHFYHFQRGTTPAQLKAEANFAVSTAKRYGYKGSYIFLDAELTSAVPSTQAVGQFYSTVRSAGYKAGFYTYKFMYPYFSKSVFTGSDGVWAAAYPLGNQATWSKPNMGYFPSVDNCVAWQFTDNWQGKNIDGSITLDDRLTLKPEKPTYYHAKLKRVRLNQPTKIYKDKNLTKPVGEFSTGEEFEIVGGSYSSKNGMTSYKTQSGYYITGNQKYVNSVYHLSQPKTIELKKTAKLYKDAEFKHPVRSYGKETQFNVVKNVELSSHRRCFKTQSGYYISANKDYAKIVRK